ncbi:unnamed protein product, partial [Rotaria magnacalcarata]
GTSTAKCYVHIQGLGLNVPDKTHVLSSLSTRGELKLEIIDINQFDKDAIELFWKHNELIG